MDLRKLGNIRKTFKLGGDRAWCPVFSRNKFFVLVVKNYGGAVYKHCVKSVRIRSYSGPHFPAFGLNAERYSDWIRRDTPYLSVFSPNEGKCGPEQLRIQTLFTQCKVFCYFPILLDFSTLYELFYPRLFSVTK